ncbi:hypothetical protein BDN72DRAFT_878461 [Pluteus cervinus]|uniref:Uncharacterized protein n=1 Tax=Pluteus cervinus TaxID=181527 RepID=A0ACD3AVM2_9AGAR|nr:hypothetical protein BDN72DRAFT_878461 [Pluteus cervinus]
MSDPLGMINWRADNGILIDKLLNEVEKPENAQILIGKRTENTAGRKNKTSGDSKTTVYKRIAPVVLPELAKLDLKVATSRVKTKWEDLFATFKKEYALLHKTGEGIGADDNGAEEYLLSYLAPSGPDENTDPAVSNLWDKICKRFPPFECLHKFLASCPNAVPPVVTTGVGPQGRRVVYYQHPSDIPTASQSEQSPSPEILAVIDPQLASQSQTNTPSASQSLAPSSQSRSASVSPAKKSVSELVDNAKKNIRKAAPKRTFEDMFIGLTKFRKQIEIAQARASSEAELADRKVALQERDQVLSMFNLKLLSREECQEKLAEIDGRFTKKPRIRSPSPKWDIEDEEPEEALDEE